MTSELEPSKLGTKEHWDSVYSEELENFQEIGDEGEIWFGAESINKMVEWCQNNVPPESHASTLEVGSGNGTLLFALLDEGYSASYLLGIDYSQDAVNLAKSIGSSRGGSAADIAFESSDFLNDDPPFLPSMTSQSWHLLLDKGTYDAIALGPKDSAGLSPASGYPERVARLLKPGGYFLITSCNFTEEELKKNFVSEATKLEYHSRIQHKTFSFGGTTGSVCASVAFIKSA